MELFEVFSRRNKLVEIKDVYQYDNISIEFRNQFVNLINRLLPRGTYKEGQFWDLVAEEVKLELGILDFATSSSPTNIFNYLLKCNTIQALDIIDILVNLLRRLSNNISFHDSGEFHFMNDKIDHTFDRINQKFRQNALGYEIVGNQLIRIDNQHIHSEVVKHAIKLLHQNDFTSASSDFMDAHKLYKDGEWESAIVKACVAFESAMKIICDKMGYSHSVRATASPLINTLATNGFFNVSSETHLNALKSSLSSGLPTIRNQTGHGQKEETEVALSTVKYALDLCATNIVYLVNLYEEKKVR
ncbi:STM4504/CBY_0614 family protein [Ureibacillus aquaedulcis]|uniref:HEPN domain-containing protein n=1 Tax=Ureibacillus aquaedulcis TaxID=3058421 RepID=A0ABT8GU28_9BACL|nr:hypothetical protein [Ureibacillus sp. BA0131]MDN4494925.1 hypothetical protein [Ureibacillus sp. BA0131]